MEFETTGAEVQEVAAPANEGAEVQEVAAPAETSQETAQSGKTEADAAFAEYRRAREDAERRAVEAERELAEFKAASEARTEAIRRLTGRENADIEALAENIGVDPQDILATLNTEQEFVKKELEIQQLREEIQSISAEKEMQHDLAVIQAIDPAVKNLDDLGESFKNYIGAGLSAEDAYYAVKAKEINTRATPPPEIGKVDNKPPEKDFFTREEYLAMSEDEQRRNYEKILESSRKW